MKLTVTPFAPSDYPRILEAAKIETPWIDDRLAHGRSYAAHGPSYTIWADDEIACTLGLVLPWPGRAACWAVWGPAGFRHAAGVHRLTVAYLRMLIGRYQLARLDADVMAEFAGGRLWVEHLGFSPEGPPLEFYGPQGETMQHYVWIHPMATQLRAMRAHRRPAAQLAPVHRPDGTLVPIISGGYGMEILAIAAIATTVVAAGVSAYAAYEQGQQQKKAYKYNAKVAENQAAIAKQQQEFAAKQQRERDRRARATARAIQSGTGVEVGEGSSLLVDVDNARQSEMNAAAAAYTGQAQQSSILDRAGMAGWQANVAERQATIGAGATLLSGLGSAAGQGYRYQTQQPSARPTGVYVDAD